MNSKYSIEYNGIYYNPVSRKQIYDFLILGDINKRIEQLQEEDVRKKQEHYKALKYLTKKESLYQDLSTKQISEIVNLYKKFYLLRLKPNTIHECLDKFRLYEFSTDLIDEKSELQEYQIIDDFISLQAAHANRTMDDLFDFGEEIDIGNGEVIHSYSDYDNALLLLRRFSKYRQEILSVQLSEQLSNKFDLPFIADYGSENKVSPKSSDSVDAIVLSVAFKDNNIQMFHVSLEMKIKNRNPDFLLNDYIIMFNNEFGKEFFRKFIVQKVIFEVDIPIYPIDGFDLNFYNQKDYKLLFYSQIEEPYPIKFTSYIFQTKFNDVVGNECKLVICDLLVLTKKKHSWLNKIIKSGYIPDGIIPTE